MFGSVFELEDVNTLYGNRIIRGTPQNLGTTSCHAQCEVLGQLADQSSISITNYGDLYICNPESCHHPKRKSRLSAEDGQTLSRKLSFVNKLRKALSRKPRAIASDANHLHDQRQHFLATQVQDQSQYFHPNVSAYQQDMPSEMAAYDANTMPPQAEMPGWPTTQSSNAFVAMQERCDNSGAHGESALPIELCNGDKLPQYIDASSAHNPNTFSSLISPVSGSMTTTTSPTWIGSGSDRSLWHMSQDSAVSGLTAASSVSASDPSGSQDLTADGSVPSKSFGSLHLNIPPAPQGPMLDRGLSMSPSAAEDIDTAIFDIENDFGAVALPQSQMLATPGLHFADVSASDVFPWANSFGHATDERGEAPFTQPNKVTTVHLTPIKDGCPEPSLDLMIGPGFEAGLSSSFPSATGIKDMLRAARDQFARDFHDSCPTDMVRHLMETFDHVLVYWDDDLDMVSIDVVTLKHLCHERPTVMAALSALQTLLVNGGHPEGLMLPDFPTPHELMSLAFLSFSLLCMAIPKGPSLIFAVQSLHQQMFCWASMINPGQAPIFRCLIDKFWKISASSSDVTTDFATTGRYNSSHLTNDGQRGGDFITDITFLFVNLVARSASHHTADGAIPDCQAEAMPPPSFDQAIRDGLLAPLDKNFQHLQDAAVQLIIEQGLTRGAFEELQKSIDDRLSHNGFHPESEIRLQTKSIVQNAGFFKSKVVVWLWRALGHAICECAQRVASGPQGLSLLTASASPSPPQPPPLHIVNDQECQREHMMRLSNAGSWVINSKPIAKPKKPKKARHSSDQVYPCDLCPKVCYGRWGQGNLRRHKKNTKKHATTFVRCYVCPQTFVRSDHHLNHMRDKHLLEKSPDKDSKWVPRSPSAVTQGFNNVVYDDVMKF